MCGWRPRSRGISLLSSPNPSDVPLSACPIRKANKSMRLLVCIVIATSEPGKCDSLLFGAMFRFMVTRVSLGISKRKELQEQLDRALRDMASFCCIFKQMLCSSARDPLINILAVDYANVYTPHTIQPIC